MIIQSPTQKEIMDFLELTFRHSMHVEYFLNALSLGDLDPQRPHDISGKGSKYGWNVVKGLSIAPRVESSMVPGVNPRETPIFIEQILPSIMYHQQRQNHHLAQKLYNPDGTSSVEVLSHLEVGAIDALCALREDRTYNGGVHSYEQISARLSGKKTPLDHFMRALLPRFKEVSSPNLSQITLDSHFNVGIPQSIYDETVRLTSEAVERFSSTEYQPVPSEIIHLRT